MPSWGKIVCPVDFSATSRRALAVAADIAKEQGAELILLHVYQLPGTNAPEATVMGEEVSKQFESLLSRRLHEWKADAEKLGAPNVTMSLELGVPFAEIVRLAESRGCGLIVMGTHGRTALMRVLIGSVAEKVVRHAPCPVLTVRPEGPVASLDEKLGSRPPVVVP